MHGPRFRWLASLGNPLSLLVTSLTFQALLSGCSSGDAAPALSGSASAGQGGSQAPSNVQISTGNGGDTRDSSGSGGGDVTDGDSGDGRGGPRTTASNTDGNAASSGSNSASGGASSSGAGDGGATSSGTGGSDNDGTIASTGKSSTGGTSATTGSGGSAGEGGSVTTGNSGSAGDGGAAGAGGEVAEHLAPALSNILVSAGATLTPAFAPDRHRYSILPEVGQSLELTAIAGEDLTVTVGSEPAGSNEPIPIEQAEAGSELEIVVSNSLGESETYTLLVLPTDFPKLVVTTRTSEVSADPLYVTPSSTLSRYLAKLDNEGVPLFYRRITGRSYDFKKHYNGQMSYALTHQEKTTEIVLDPSFAEVDVVDCVGADTDMHEFLMLENGNFVMVCSRDVVRDFSSCGGSTSTKLVDSIIQELSPERELLFEWNSWDHMECEDRLGPKTGDIAHANSVFVDTDGDWLVSLRYMSQILKIDSNTGDVIWRLGGPRSDFEFVDDPWGGLCGQHTAARLDNGHILAFDNGKPCAAELADRPRLTRVVEYELDEVAMTATLVWSYSREGQFAEHQGSAQRLPNGNTVIGWGADENDPRFVTEVDAAGNIVFELEASVAGQSNSVSYRARRFPD